MTLSLTGCFGAKESPSGHLPGVLKVAASVSPITDLVAQVGGERVKVSGLVPEGIDSHTFEARPATVQRLMGSKALFVNGLGLEDPLIRIARTRASGIKVVALGESVPRSQWIFDRSFPASSGHPNPHLWTSPVYAKRFVSLIASQLSKLDREGATYYRKNAIRLTSKLTTLDEAIRASTKSVAEKHRKLVTYHDSFPYFAREYGWKVVAAIQPASFTEPSARDVALMIEQIKSEGVPAIFGSEVFPSPTLEVIARKSGARYVDSLRDDDLPGESGDDKHSYIGLILFDIRTIVKAMGGDDAPLAEVDPSHLYEGNASYD